MSKKVAGFFPVLVAMTNNLFITCIKFVGYFISGSGSMFSEAVHSLADAANQALLMVGIKRSQKGPSDKFYYGHGQERFFWALVSSCGIFFVGAGATVYHGVASLFHKEASEINSWVFIILAVSLVLEGASLIVAIKELKEKNNLPLWQAIKKGDPTTLAILYEDGVAVLGVLLAFISIALTALTGSYWWDSIGSIIIGLLLGFIAIVLADMNRGFLIEKAIPKADEDKIAALLKSNKSIVDVKEIKTSILGIDEYRIKCKVQFSGSFVAEKAEKGCPASQLPQLIGEEIDAIKKMIQKEAPEAKYINIEIC